MILPQFRLHFNTNINFFVILQNLYLHPGFLVNSRFPKKNFGRSNKVSQEYQHMKNL